MAAFFVPQSPASSPLAIVYDPVEIGLSVLGADVGSFTSQAASEAGRVSRMEDRGRQS